MTSATGILLGVLGPPTPRIETKIGAIATVERHRDPFDRLFGSTTWDEWIGA